MCVIPECVMIECFQNAGIIIADNLHSWMLLAAVSDG